MKRLEVVNNQGVRIICGCEKSTTVEHLLAETDLVPMMTRIEQLTAIGYEKVIRMGDQNPV